MSYTCFEEISWWYEGKYPKVNSLFPTFASKLKKKKKKEENF